MNHIVKKVSLLVFFSILSSSYCFGFSEKIDEMRGNLGCPKNISPEQYTREKNKLNKLIEKNKINYSNEERFKDIQRLIKEKKYNAALYELNELIDLGYEKARCLDLKGDICRLSNNDNIRAYNYYRQSLEADPKNSWAAFKISKLYIEDKKTTLGIEYLKQVAENTNDEEVLDAIISFIDTVNVTSDLDKSNLYDILGQIYIKQNNKSKATEAYTKALELNPQDIDLRYRLANILDYNDPYAIEVYNSILKENPQDSQIRSSKARLLFKEGKFSSADKEYATILALYPDSNQAKYGIYKLYEYKLPPEKILLKFYENDPKHVPSKKEVEKFIEFLKEIGDEQAAKNFEEYLNKGKVALPEQKQEKKEEKTKTKPKPKTTTTPTESNLSYDEIKNIQNENVLAQKELQNNLKSAKYLKYKSQIDSYLNTPEKTSEIYIATANTYKLASMPYNSLKYYREARKLDPINSDIYFDLGLTYLELNNLKSSKENLQKAIDLDKSNRKAYNLIGFVNQKIITQIINNAYSKFSDKKYIEAFEILDGGIKKFPNSAQMYFYRAQVLEAMNRNTAAISDLKKAVELDGSYYMAYYELGKLYEKAKDDKNALVVYERFLSTEPQEQDLVEEVQKKVIELGKKYY